MQPIGDEQTFQALFRELRLRDEQIAPGFSAIWNRARPRIRSRPWLRLSFVVPTAVLIVSLFSLTFWLRARLKNLRSDTAVVIASAISSINPAPVLLQSDPIQISAPVANKRMRTMHRAEQIASRRRKEMAALRDLEMRYAVAVSSWQSPTAMLMQSPPNDVLTSLPELYRSVSEMNSFLPDAQK